MEVSEPDIEFDSGTFRVRGTDRQMSLADVAQKSRQGAGLSEGFNIGLDGSASHAGPNTYPNGCMICEVEIDVETGVVDIVSVSAVDDAGVIINPLIVEGQLHGSTAQGLGEALFEQIVYERGTGQLLTASFSDYVMPRADDIPYIKSDTHSVPATSNPLGVKGGSEAGNVGAPAAIVNAIIDALLPLRVTDVQLPVTSERIWKAIQLAKDKSVD
jgi:carbon-monoxide dehydrogenase large subunit